YYASSRLIDVKTSDKEIKNSTERIEHRNLPGQSTSIHIVAETYSFALPRLANRFIRGRLTERIATLDREMAKSVSQADFSLQLLRDQLVMQLRLHPSD